MFDMKLEIPPLPTTLQPNFEKLLARRVLPVSMLARCPMISENRAHGGRH